MNGWHVQVISQMHFALRKFIPFESVWRPAVLGNITGYAVIAVGLIAWEIIHH